MAMRKVIKTRMEAREAKSAWNTKREIEGEIADTRELIQTLEVA